MEVDGGEARPLVVRERSVGGFGWSPDGSRVAFLAPDEPSAEDRRREEERDDAHEYGAGWHHQRLWTVAADGSDVRLLWSPDHHLAELAWSPDGRRIALLGRRSPLLEHLATTQVAVVTLGAGDGSMLASAGWASTTGWSGADTLVWAGPHDGAQSSATVCALPVTGGEPRVVGTGAEGERCTSGLAPAADGGRPLLTVTEGLDDRLEWLDVATGRREVAVGLPGDPFSVDVVTGPTGRWSPSRSSMPTAGRRCWPGQPDALRPVSDHGRPDVPLGTVEDLVCTASDGTRLEAVVIVPPGAGSGPWPTAVLLHGGPYGRSGRSAHLHPLDWGQLLASRGYAVVLPNYRGSRGRGNAFATAARGSMGIVEWDDV